MTMEKVIKEGRVAVLYSPGFGAGWYSWNPSHKELVFHPKLVQMVEDKRQKEITDEWVLQELGIDIYTGGAEQLRIEWIDEGTAFRIDEYDGSESITTSSDFDLVT